jgi:ribosome production factor 1
MASFHPHKIANKQKRQQEHLKNKKQKESTKRDERLRRRREERRAKNVPATIDSKRTWDQATADEEAEGKLGLSVDILNPKRRKIEELPLTADEVVGGEVEEEEDDEEIEDEDVNDDGDLGSMLDSDSENEDEIPEEKPPEEEDRAPSEAPSAATDLNLTPEILMQRFPSLFDGSDKEPKVLVTTSINSTLHYEAGLLTTLFPNSSYIKRTAHFHSYKYSIREISAYAAARDYTTVIVLTEERKKPKGLDIVHLPEGPMFHFTISNWVEGKKIPGHGNPTNHFPELILNGFKTPLGLLTAHLFKSLFPPRPELQGRQAVTLHNQRDYIFVRRHRYVFRDKRGSEKSIQGTDGKPMKGVEEIRAGLQELGPRFTLKLRRIDRGIQRASGQEWEWKAGDEKVRTRFSL